MHSYILFHSIPLDHITVHYITIHYIILHCITPHYITLHYTTLHYITLQYITLNCITFHYVRTYTIYIQIHVYIYIYIPIYIYTHAWSLHESSNIGFVTAFFWVTYFFQGHVGFRYLHLCVCSRSVQSFNRQGCYVEAPHGIVVEALCGLEGYQQSRILGSEGLLGLHPQRTPFSGLL